MIKTQIYSIREEIKDKCRNFAKEVARTTNYSDNNQFNIQKIENDHYISKMGELAIAKLFNCDPPDFQIYQGKNKNWNADLISKENNYKIHVKSQRGEDLIKYSPCLIFQYDPKGRKDTIFNDPNNLVGYAVVKNNIVLAIGAFKLSELKFGFPFSPSLRGFKKVAYLALSHPELLFDIFKFQFPDYNKEQIEKLIINSIKIAKDHN